MPEHQIRILTFNCWGLKFVSKFRRERIEALAQELIKSPHDIIALQEIWVLADFEHVRDTIAKRLPYSKFFYSGALGAGLAIFSRFPIISTSVHPYSLNGAPIDVAAGDWFVGKAAASVVLSHPVLGQVQVFNTHVCLCCWIYFTLTINHQLFAKGGEDGPEYNRAHRLVNAWEFAKLARQAAELGRYVIAAGDFNSIPTTLPITVIREHAGLTDSWSVVSPSESNSLSAASPLEAITRFGVTADSPLNSFSGGKPLDQHTRGFWGKRLDYIFYRQPTRHYRTSQTTYTLKCTDCKVVLTHKPPGCLYSFSDHFGLESTLEIRAVDNADADMPHGMRRSDDPLSVELSPAAIGTTIQALTSCYRFSRQRSRRELIIFGLCLILLAALAVGSAWLPHPWINPYSLSLPFSFPGSQPQCFMRVSSTETGSATLS
ncbi:Endonuclease/exonuclease/phosphatase [Infundibulicybe gibba]|nr:Endonuclease/exonuclease/phosphatase [Infundibulicybe gibba]